MTTKQIVEQILEVFPQYTETLVKLDVNRVYKDFCYKTRILKKQGDLEVVVNTVEYTLPTDFQELVWVKLMNSNTVENTTVVTYRIEGGKIKFFDEYSEDLTTLPSGATKIRLYYVYIPTDLSALTGSPVIPDMFREALIEGVYEKYYRRQGILQQHGASKQYYKEAVIEGKRYANIDGDKTINITPHYF